MYFVNEEHERNFYHILHYYSFAKKDPKYQSSFYIAAHPTIFKDCNWARVFVEGCPLNRVFIGGKSELSENQLQLVHAGISLFKDHKKNSLFLALSTWNNELINVFVQACKIRHGEIVEA